ncbi:PLP-dependent aminotransferase family protein [Blautia schinkii]|nr:PLP-dependent aminotransferase family protein [Blautia schinkii]
MINLNRQSREPLYMQIYTQIKNEILNGTIGEGQILAGSRGLAGILGVSRNTVDGAYSQLMAEGYITPQKGVGYIVMKVPELTICRRKPVQNAIIPPVSDTKKEPSVVYDLTNGSQTSDLFPKRIWKRYTLECMDLLENEAKISSYQDKQGELYLREKLLAYLERIRGIHCDANQIIITCGIQQSLDYLCKLLYSANKTILMEEPGFNKAVAVFHNSNINIQTVPVDKNGIVVSKLPHTANVCAVYATPSHQFPTGATLSISRRYELLEWAQKNDVFIIEDDFDSEQRYYSKPIPSLQSIDKNNCVIYLGTFSKALSPSIRMGYMILPPLLLQNYLKKFEIYNSTVPLLNQYVIARLIETGEYDRHVRRLNHIFRKRLEQFSAELADVKGNVELSSNGTGQYFLLKFSHKVEQNELIKKALEHGVKVYSTMQFWQEKAACPPNTLFLGFSKIQLEDIPDCVKRLKAAWAEWL